MDHNKAMYTASSTLEQVQPENTQNPAKEKMLFGDDEFFHNILEKYGSFRTAFKICGETVIRNHFVKSIQNFYSIYGRAPKKSEMKYANAICKFLGSGSWGRAIQAAGLRPSTFHKMTKQEMIQLILSANSRLGHTPRSVDIPQAFTIIRHFGSWNNAIKAAGLQPWTKKHNSRVNISNQDLLLGIQILYICKEGRRPYYREYEHAGLCLKRFGKWNIAVDKALADPFNTMQTAKILAQTAIRK